SERVVRIPTDDQGRMRSDQLRSILAGISTPVLVCAQAGNVNTGSFDPISEIAACIRERPSWLHVDGAFGLWAAASPTHRSLTQGIEMADSVSVDCHKWLNVPYDSGVVFVRDATSHQAAMSLHASYYVTALRAERDNCNWVPEASRRARGFTVYAALRFLGGRGIAELIDRCCRLARRMASRLKEFSDAPSPNRARTRCLVFLHISRGQADTARRKKTMIKRDTAEHYRWGQGCEGWHLLKHADLSVIRERMPPKTSEVNHYH